MSFIHHLLNSLVISIIIVYTFNENELVQKRKHTFYIGLPFWSNSTNIGLAKNLQKKINKLLVSESVKF